MAIGDRIKLAGEDSDFLSGSMGHEIHLKIRDSWEKAKAEAVVGRFLFRGITRKLPRVMLVRRKAENGVVYYASPLLEKVGVLHAFSTRIGGVSSAPFDSLNLGHLSGCANPDTDQNIEANYKKLQ